MIRGFERACRKCHGEVLAFARRLIKNNDIADDVVQDSMIRAMRAWDNTTFAAEDDPDMAGVRGWMYRIVTNTFYNRYRADARRREVTVLLKDEIAAYPGEWHMTHLLEDMGDEVAEAIARLGDDRWELVRRHYFDEQPYPEIVQEMGMPQGTVGSRLSRARIELAEGLADYARREYRMEASVLCAARKRTPSPKASKAPQADADSVDRVVAGDDAAALVGT